MTDKKITNSRYIFGIDIGGTTCKMGFFEQNGSLVDKWEIPSDKSNGGMNVITDIAEAIDSKLEELNIDKSQVIGIGTGIPASISGDGTVQNCPNLGWRAFNVPEKLGAATGLPVACGNDANIAALGEIWQGVGEGCSNMLFVTLGTGVGGGIVCDGRILTGAHGCGAELGHMKVNPSETRLCGCGNRGCLEQYVSATGIVNMAKDMLSEYDQKKKKTVLSDLREITAKAVFDGAKNRDELCQNVVERFGEILGRALATACVVFDPEIIVIGGGVSKAGSIITDVVSRYYREWAFSPCAEIPFALATLGNDAGIYGSAKIALDAFG